MRQPRLDRILLSWGIMLPILCLCLVGCEAQKRIVLQADGQERILETSAATVRDALREAEITLGAWDRVEPSLWMELPRSAIIRVIRVREQSERQTLPFGRQIVRDEALPEGKTRLLQSGQTGTLEITYRVSLDGPQEIDRQLVAQQVITEARSEIIAVGATNDLPAVPLSGTVAYLANGNAWIIRRSSSDRRPVTFSGDLDGRVLDLSANGQFLLFTRQPAPATAISTTLNSLWVLDTRILQEGPQPLGVSNVLYAEWSHDGTRIAYSTGEGAQGSPGWKAHNDLWTMSFPGADQKAAPGPFVQRSL